MSAAAARSTVRATAGTTARTKVRAAATTARPAARTRALPARPVPATPAVTATALRLVPRRRSSAARAPFAAVVVGLLVTGLLSLLALNTALAQDAFRLDTLVREGNALTEREQLLQREVEALRAPASLAARAADLGLVPGGPPAFLRLPDGKVLGAPVAAKSQPRPEAPPPSTTTALRAVGTGTAPAKAAQTPAAATPTAAATTTAPRSSTTWTSPRRSPAPPAGGNG